MLDFRVYPSVGHLNTKFGVRVFGKLLNKKYKISFIEESVSTDWMNDLAHIYYNFNIHGKKTIELETTDGNKVSRSIIVQNSAIFGTGITERIEVAGFSKNILIQKSNGLLVYSLEDKQGVYYDIKYKRMYEISKNLILLELPNKLVSFKRYRLSDFPRKKVVSL